MNQTILFTAVGGTDPISEDNYYDGSMMHICRYYRPDKVIMYMSKEMLDKQEKDDRYRYCLENLAKQQDRDMEYEIIERRNLTRVHEFDYFYQDLRNVFEELFSKMDETDTLILNISSGTPAMKSGLLVLQTLGEFPAKLIQVATPEKRLGTHTHAEQYDRELMWQLNQDAEKYAENRCKEVSCPTLSKLKKEEIIKKHIKAYDYRAALDAADTLSEEESAAYRDLIYLAERRLMLDFSNMDCVAEKWNFQCVPVRTSSERKYFEYALSMDIKLRKKEYADFIRAISPLIVDLFELILKKQCGITVEDYCHYVKRKGFDYSMRQWCADKLKKSQAGEVLYSYYEKKHQIFTAKEIYSAHLKILLDYFSDNEKLISLIKDIRHVEEKIRNIAAHEIVSITEEVIKSRTGFTSKKIMDMIKELFTYTGITVCKEYWNSYDEMNKKILQKI